MRPLSLALVLSAVAALCSATEARATFIVTKTGTLDGLSGTANFDGALANIYPINSLYLVTITETVSVTGYIDLDGGASGGTAVVDPKVFRSLKLNGGTINESSPHTPVFLTLAPNETRRYEFTLDFTTHVGLNTSDFSTHDPTVPFTLAATYDNLSSVFPFSLGGTVSATGRDFTGIHSDVVVTYTYMPAPQGAALLLGAAPFAVAFRRRLFPARPASVQG